MDELVMSPRAFNFPPHSGKARLQKRRHDVIKSTQKGSFRRDIVTFRKGFFFEIQVIISCLQCFYSIFFEWTQVLLNTFSSCFFLR